MSFFLSTDEFSVIKNEDNQSYTIEFKQPSRLLINSIIKSRLLTGTMITNDYKSLLFNALSIHTLESYQHDLNKRNNTPNLPYDAAMKMIFSLSKQIEYLLKNSNMSFYKFNKKNIVVIDEEIFIYLSNEDLTERENDLLLLTTTFDFDINNNYFSPELLRVKTIPSRIHYKTIYYSLGLLLANSLSNDDELIQIQSHTPDLLIEDKILHTVENAVGKSKIYYFLTRCLDREIKRRSLIYI